MVLHRIQRALLFPRGFVRGDDAIARRVPRLERWWHETEAGAVEAWFVPGEGVSADRPGPAVLHAHGNAELIEHWVEPLARYRRLGVSLLLVEYRGYGRSAGRPGEEAIRADTRAFYDRLVAGCDCEGYDPLLAPTRESQRGVGPRPRCFGAAPASPPPAAHAVPAARVPAQPLRHLQPQLRLHRGHQLLRALLRVRQLG